MFKTGWSAKNARPPTSSSSTTLRSHARSIGFSSHTQPHKKPSIELGFLCGGQRGTRTLKPYRQRILSPQRIPIPPSAHCWGPRSLRISCGVSWRRERDSHPCKRFCRPLPNSSVIAPRRSLRACLVLTFRQKLRLSAMLLLSISQ
jgi:hypothetical protein